MTRTDRPGSPKRSVSPARAGPYDPLSGGPAIGSIDAESSPDWSLLLLALSGLVTFAGIGTMGQFLGWPVPVTGLAAAVASFGLWFLAGTTVRANGLAAGLSLLVAWAVLVLGFIAFLNAGSTLGEAGGLMKRFLCATLGGHGPGCQ